MDRAAHRVRPRAKTCISVHGIQAARSPHPASGPRLSREQLLDTIWGSDVYVEARTVDVHVGRLRKALNGIGERDPIRTVRSAGYALDDTFAA